MRRAKAIRLVLVPALASASAAASAAPVPPDTAVPAPSVATAPPFADPPPPTYVPPPPADYAPQPGADLVDPNDEVDPYPDSSQVVIDCSNDPDCMEGVPPNLAWMWSNLYPSGVGPGWWHHGRPTHWHAGAHLVSTVHAAAHVGRGGFGGHGGHAAHGG